MWLFVTAHTFIEESKFHSINCREPGREGERDSAVRTRSARLRPE